MKIKFGNKYLILFTSDKNIHVYGSISMPNSNEVEGVQIGKILADKVRKFDCGWFHAIVLRSKFYEKI